MQLTKYQKSYLQEYMWDVHHDEDTNNDENTCWLRIDPEDGVIFDVAKKLLRLEHKECNNIKVLVIASIVE